MLEVQRRTSEVVQDSLSTPKALKKVHSSDPGVTHPGVRQGDQPGLRRTEHAGTELVSVVIPCYNQAHFLEESIGSVLAQTYQRFEIVVVDDGSTDNTSEVAARYPKVRCIRQDNQGLSRARNTGIRHSRGEYLVFLDADDRLLPEALKAGLECFHAHPECAFVFGRFRYIATDGKPLNAPAPATDHGDHYIGLLRGPYIAVPAMVMYRGFVFDTVGLFDPSVNATADYDLYFRIARKFPAHRHETLVAEYRQHATNMTGDAGKMLRGAIENLRRQEKYVKGDQLRKEAYKDGRRFWHGWYGDPLVEQVRAQMHQGEWGQAVRGMQILLRYYPQGLALLVNGRRRLSRQLESRNEQLRNRERQLRELRAALEEERRKLGQVQRQNRQLVKRERNVLRQLQDIQKSETWKLLRTLAHFRIKVARK